MSTYYIQEPNQCISVQCLLSNTNNTVGPIHSSFPCNEPCAIIELSKDKSQKLDLWSRKQYYRSLVGFSLPLHICLVYYMAALCTSARTKCIYTMLLYCFHNVYIQ